MRRAYTSTSTSRADLIEHSARGHCKDFSEANANSRLIDRAFMCVMGGGDGFGGGKGIPART